MEDVMTQDCRPWSEQDIADVKEMAGTLPEGSSERPKLTESATRIPARKLAVPPAEAMDAAASETQTIPTRFETVTAPAAIERALTIYQQLQPRIIGDSAGQKNPDAAYLRNGG